MARYAGMIRFEVISSAINLMVRMLTTFPVGKHALPQRHPAGLTMLGSIEPDLVS
jgi:hypothetical protein